MDCIACLVIIVLITVAVGALAAHFGCEARAEEAAEEAREPCLYCGR